VASAVQQTKEALDEAMAVFSLASRADSMMLDRVCSRTLRPHFAVVLAGFSPNRC